MGELLPIGHQVSFNTVGTTVGDTKNRIINEVISLVNNSTDKNRYTPISIALLKGEKLIANWDNDEYTLPDSNNAYIEVFGTSISSGKIYFNYRLTEYWSDKIIFGQVTGSVFSAWKQV